MGLLKSLVVVASCGAVLSLWLPSCTTSMCTDNRTSIPEAGFYNVETDEPVNIVGVTIGGIGAPNDSLLYKDQTEQLVYLPLRPAAEVTSFRFHFSSDDSTDPDTGEVIPDDSHDDIVTFYYSSTPYFDGEECGAIQHFHIDRVDHTPNGHIVDIEILDPYVTNEHKEYLRFYFRIADSDDGSGNEPDAPADGGDDESATPVTMPVYEAKGGNR